MNARPLYVHIGDLPLRRLLSVAIAPTTFLPARFMGNVAAQSAVLLTAEV